MRSFFLRTSPNKHGWLPAYITIDYADTNIYNCKAIHYARGEINMSQRTEALMRIPIGIISGIIIGLWGELVGLLSIINFFIILFRKKRSISISDFANIWVSESYRFYRYMNFTTDNRPFPWKDLRKVRDPLDIPREEKKKR